MLQHIPRHATVQLVPGTTSTWLDAKTLHRGGWSGHGQYYYYSVLASISIIGVMATVILVKLTHR